MINKKGLAQIPLMIVLLIMAIAVPIATRLVQQNQENRGQAACYANYAGCNNNASCCSGVCSGVCMPAPTTKPPTAKPPTAPPSCVGSGGSCATKGCCAGLNCFLGTCRSEIGPINPSATPIPRICNPGATKCRDTNSVDVCNTNGTGWSILRTCAYGCLNGDCKAAPPTAVPPTTAPACRTEGQSCANVTCCNSQGLFCNSARICAGPPTATPTNDPRQPCGSWRSDECSTGSCTGGSVCINNHATGSKCLCITPTATPTNDPRQPCGSWRSDECSTGSCTGGNVCINNHSIDSKCVCIAPTATPTKIPGGPIIPIVTTNPPVGDKCPDVEACPNTRENDLLQNCTPADADGTSKDTRCYADTVGTRGQCGGKEYCCPSTGGAWTLDMTNCPTPINPPTTCTQCAGNPDAKLKGDADCSGSTNLNDFSIWRREFDEEGDKGTVSQNTWNADFDCDGKVTLNDYSIWRPIYTSYIKGLLNN